MSPRSRILRYGVSIAVALAGVVCGAVIPGSAGGTAATVLVGIGLVGVLSLIFYEVGLTEDRERARRQEPGERIAPRPTPPDHGAPGEHQGGRIRPLERRRGQRRRLR
jgi:hypothetical protein